MPTKRYSARRAARVREVAPELHHALTELVAFLDKCLISGSEEVIAQAQAALQLANQQK